jgi:hypothetical protein
MRTTDGRKARAAAENAADSTRASLGASVRGVTTLPGASDGAGAAGDVGAGSAPGFGAGAERLQPAAAAHTTNETTRPIRTDAI